MGHILSTAIDYVPDGLAQRVSESYRRRSTKRKLISNEVGNAVETDTSYASKRRKLTSTTKYIYQTLFIDGKDSDVTVKVLDKEFKLHKIYLGQSMFSGAWQEANKNYVSIETEDPYITQDALFTVFGSFYQDEIIVDPNDVISILATASMFQVQGLIEQCMAVMLETISPGSVVKYYKAACNYGACKVKNEILDWFSVNFVDYYWKNPTDLKEINENLMAAILSHPNLEVIQTETTLYFLLRKWMYFRVKDESEIATKKSEVNFFKNRENTFLFTPEGRTYLPLFEMLRLNHMVYHTSDLRALTQDKIFPDSWMMNAYKFQWTSLLQIWVGNDKGPDKVDEDFFNKNCFRCGHILKRDAAHSWRWSGFSYGIDLTWSLIDNVLTVERLLGFQNFSAPMRPHNVNLSVHVLNLGEKRQILKEKKTEIMRLSLTSTSQVVMSLKEFDYPLYLFSRVLITSPPLQTAPT